MSLVLGVLLIVLAAAMRMVEKPRPDGSQLALVNGRGTAQLYVHCAAIGVGGVITWFLGNS